MKVIYTNTGEIIDVLRTEADYFYSRAEYKPAVSIFEIDEVDPENRGVCRDLIETLHKVNINGEGKYYMNGGELYITDGWEEPVEDLI